MFPTVSHTSRGAVVTYIESWSEYSQKHPGVEFLLTTFESWRRSVGHYPSRKFDLVAITTELVGDYLQQHAVAGRLCQVLPLSSFDKTGISTLQNQNFGVPGGAIHPHSQCWILTHRRSASGQWQLFPLAHEVIHIASPHFMAFVGALSYSMLAKVRSTEASTDRECGKCSRGRGRRESPECHVCIARCQWE
jgi:hypothetical protein